LASVVIVGGVVVRRVEGGEVRVAAFEDEAVQGAGDAERQGVGPAAGVARPAEHAVGDLGAGCEAVGDEAAEGGR
jgi:hypothetical protein